MSIIFRNTEGKAYHLDVDKVYPNIISGGSVGRIKKLGGMLENTEEITGSRGMTVINGEYKGVKVSCVPTGMGPASTSIIIPEVIESATSDDIVLLRLGTAGALQKYIDIGDMVIAEGAIRDESTTEALVDKDFPSIASPELLPIMIASAEEEGYNLNKDLWKGIIHTKDDLYFKEVPESSPRERELSKKLHSYKEMGVLSSSMEFSVYTILKEFYESKFNKRILTGVFHSILANPTKEEEISIDKDFKHNMINDMLKIGLGTIVKVERVKNNNESINFNDKIRDMI